MWWPDEDSGSKRVMDDIQVRQIEGQKKTIAKLKKTISGLQKKIDSLERDLGIREETGYVDLPSLPLIIIGAGYRARPVCEKHGAMVRYKNDIWRCEGCKTAVDLSQSLRWIREEYDGVVVIK